MMMKVAISITLAALLFGCGFESRKQDLDERELRLNERERALILKEKELTFLTDSLKRRLVTDTVSVINDMQAVPLPDSLAGTWEVSMLCTRSNCQGFAVGDTRKETWIFSARDEAVGIRALQGEKLIRVYTGLFNGSRFKMTIPTNLADSLAPAMTVDLKIENTNKLSGERVITQTDGCNTVFKVDVTRSAKTP